MKKLIPIIALIASLCTQAKAQDWHSLTATHNLSEDRQVLRLQRGDQNTYGFLDLFGKKADFESVYAEFRARKDIGKGFSVGLEYNGGTDVKDLVRPHLAYSTELGPVFLDVKFSPLESTLEKLLGFAVNYGTSCPNYIYTTWAAKNDEIIGIL